MPKNILRLIVFSFVIALTLEVSLRAAFFGKIALNPELMNSYRVILDTPYIQRAANTDLYYELKPNLDVIHSGKPLVTNSRGLADKEYSLEKPAGTYRVIVLGSSWSMATGVGTQDSYQAVLEERLGNIMSDQRVEVINFGVEYYGLAEIIATARQKAMEYDPDMIIFAITSTTPAILWVDDKEPYTPQEVVPPFYQSYLYSTVAQLFGQQAYAKTVRPTVPPMRGHYMRQIRRATEQLSELIGAKDIDVAVLWLTYRLVNESMLVTSEKHVLNQGFRFIHIHMDSIAEENGVEGPFMTPGRGKHPNVVGHELIADKIIREVWGETT